MLLRRAKARPVESKVGIPVVRLFPNRFRVFDHGAVVVLCTLGTLSEVIRRGRRASTGCNCRKQPDGEADAAQISAAGRHYW
jgi:hypothetical protein